LGNPARLGIIMATKAFAILKAKQAMRLFLTRGLVAPTFKWRTKDGRWDIYSIDVDQWHISIKDNGAIVSCIDCTPIDGQNNDER
jgi:hypothetical protein